MSYNSLIPNSLILKEKVLVTAKKKICGNLKYILRNHQRGAGSHVVTAFVAKV